MSINVTRYNFEELVRAAIAFDAPQEAIDALGAWFDLYGERYYNGEGYDASLPGEPTGTRTLYPVFAHDEETDMWNTVRWTFEKNEHFDSL